MKQVYSTITCKVTLEDKEKFIRTATENDMQACELLGKCVERFLEFGDPSNSLPPEKDCIDILAELERERKLLMK